MVKLVALYKRPKDVETFERVYFGQHIPLTEKMPGLRRLDIDRVTGAPYGDPAYYLMASLYFDDADAMAKSMASEESRAAARVLRDLDAEVSMLLADGDDKVTVPAHPVARPAGDFAFGKILYSKGDGRATVTINRPKVYNALDFQTLKEMSQAFEDASWDDAVAVVVLTGAGERAFCTGADVREMQQFTLGGKNDMWKWMGAFLEAHDRLRNIGKPTIARLNGMTIGGGNEFQLGCDLAVAADDVVFRQTDVARGAAPAGGSTQILPLLVGDRRAREIMWLGEEIPAQKALEWGLVNRVAPRAELDAVIDDMVEKIKATLPESFRYTRQQTNFWKDLAWHGTVGHARDWLAIHATAPETREGFSAFVEKRPIDYAAVRSGDFRSAATQTCPSCGASDNPRAFAFCGRCGHSLAQE